MAPTRRAALAALAGLGGVCGVAGCTTQRERPLETVDTSTSPPPGSPSTESSARTTPTSGTEGTPDYDVLVDEGITYRETPEADLELDVVRPAGVERPPAVVYVHGGGWAAGGRRQFRPRARWMARRGYAGVLVDYRLTDQATYPAAVRDVAAAFGWTRASADRLGVADGPVLAVGWSAGAHLSALVSAAPERFVPASAPADPELAGVVGYSGIYDLTGAYADERIVREFIGGTIEEHPERYREASPVTHVDGGEPPTRLLAATDDTLVPVEQSRTYRDALIGAGADADLFVAPSGGHDFFFLADWVPETRRRLAAVANATLR